MRRIALAGLAIAIAVTPATGEPPSPAADFAAVLNTGDQAAYERWAAARVSPAALKDWDAAGWGDTLARLYVDTGGLEIERTAGEAPGWVQARARARLTGVSYCLTLKRDAGGLTDLTTSEIHPAGPGLADPEPQAVAAMVRRLADAYHARGDFDGQIVLEHEGRVLLRRAWGFSDRAHRRPVTMQTRFNGASIGKSLAAVAIAQLVEAGKLRFDDTVGTVLPDYPDREVRDGVTIRQLLTHTSGMGPKDYYDDPRWPAVRKRLRTVDDYLQLVVGKPLGAKPGERYEYSNAGYVLLGKIVERLSGRNYHDYVRDHIFAPARMTRSLYAEIDGQEPDVATPLTRLRDAGGIDTDGYIYRLGPFRDASHQLAARGGPMGGAYFTADDLLRFEHAFLGGKLVSPAMVREMTTPQFGVGGRRGVQAGVQTGLGFEITSRNGHTMVGHQGGDLGIGSFIYRFPETGYTLVVLANHDPRAVRVLISAPRGLITRRSLNGATPPPQDCVPPA